MKRGRQWKKFFAKFTQIIYEEKQQKVSIINNYEDLRKQNWLVRIVACLECNTTKLVTL